MKLSSAVIEAGLNQYCYILAKLNLPCSCYFDFFFSLSLSASPSIFINSLSPIPKI